MGKKNKNVVKTEAVQEEQQEQMIEEKPVNPADDDALIPYHTKQASLAVIYLLFFSILMFTLPFASFYGVRHALHEYLQIDGFPNTCWSVLAAVVTVNFVIAVYAVVGFLDAKKEEQTVLQFSQNKAKIN
ncbi:hypothetical protein PVAND_012521 [Polypedilum vanderplanki]|uniref:Vacuolar ATPase assembly integral membrane protein VMA21 homolog n=1 Tax=Polypedilum vanderplanki TaxID=319348 RepID=A0A9J6CMS4_POLVA|nr:hypothetical protein PVAND_012521 [Polypedilum vanderplanki]